jgi:hypothetical protein
MVKAVSIRSLVMSFLAISKMDGDMANSFVSISMGQGLCLQKQLSSSLLFFFQ